MRDEVGLDLRIQRLGAGGVLEDNNDGGHIGLFALLAGRVAEAEGAVAHFRLRVRSGEGSHPGFSIRLRS